MRGEAPPRVSVVIPLHQGAGTIGQALAGVLGQSFSDFEVVVVDDGSTDGGAEAAAALADPRVRLIRQGRQGVAAARNRGLLGARAAWVAFLDAGDLWREDHLAEMVAGARFGDAVAIFGNYVLESRGRPVIPMSVPARRVPDLFAFALAVHRHPVHASAVMVERAAAIDAGLFPVGAPAGEDTDLWCRLALQGAFRYVARPTAIHRDRLRGARPRIQGRVPPPPRFSRTLARLVRDGAVPPALVATARRYGNLLLLEYAGELLEAGDPVSARRVLLRDCSLASDPVRYLKRVVRTFTAGQALHAASRSMGRAR
ncbi:hypothetical protein OPKNFCMD_3582 [Methylobacterium crusticola]|uniref:Glycosyltransferase 2-like domain-containing protein n=1 Tax=Methylobacterium crusticola TaxID=1697972 RepID=A0ABQ4R086_9HYPH|nr:glycosyltransferase family 2 protein [Methylobacterium crusticola]GJD50834.1 hypothetical protein OPKNFCMD_3582 [Methylobacterium crusticola]